MSNKDKSKNATNDSLTISVYIEGGNVFNYDVKDLDAGKEHASEIIRTGYRHTTKKGSMTHYPPHRVIKVKIVGATPKKKDSINDDDITVSIHIEGNIVITEKAESNVEAREMTNDFVRVGVMKIDDDGTMTHIPPHRIIKMVVDKGVTTKYFDDVSGT